VFCDEKAVFVLAAIQGTLLGAPAPQEKVAMAAPPTPKPFLTDMIARLDNEAFER
jgi:hypothetical protein